MATLASNVTRSIAQTAQYVQELWTREVEKPFTKSLKLVPLVTDRSSLASGGGDIINIPFLAVVDSRVKAASTDVVYDSPEGTAILMNIDKHYYSAVKIEEIAKVQSKYGLKDMFQEAQAEAVARQIDGDLAARWTDATNTVAGGASVDDADIIAVVGFLDGTDTPQDMRRGVVGAGGKGDLLNVNKYVAYDQTGKTGKAVDGSTGLIASLYSMDIYLSTNLVTSTTGKEIFFHKKALSIAQQLKPTYEVEWSVDSIAMKTVLHAIYGVKTERPGSLVTLTRTTAP